MKSLRTRWRLWLSILTGATLIGLAYTYNYSHYADNYVKIFSTYPTFVEMLVWEMPYWLLWAMLSPLVFWLDRRFSLERRSLLRNIILVQAVAFVAFSLAHRAVYLLIDWNLNVRAYTGLGFLSVVYNDNFFFNLPNGFLCYGTILLASNYYRHYQQAELQVTQARLQALQMQLHPHFLFNTLHSISALMKDDVKAAGEMLTRLGDFLQLTLKNSGADEVTLEDELKFTSCYLDIESVSFQDRLTVEMEVEPETLKARVPNLILQPLVENAILHGIMARVGKGRVAIRSSRRDGQLRLEVEDNGPGLQADSDATRRPKGGRGFALTRERLEHLYATRHRFLLSDAPGGGLRVTLEIPFSVSAAAPAEAPAGGEKRVAVV
ncbi:MAG TPA: histidine kinase [Pyrinomonadaceae bacterium]|nr:histidine kinase [Pyrinomonadaceae bacterium]